MVSALDYSVDKHNKGATQHDQIHQRVLQAGMGQRRKVVQDSEEGAEIRIRAKHRSKHSDRQKTNFLTTPRPRTAATI